jgi:DNA-binding transcriptional regulator YbjK
MLDAQPVPQSPPLSDVPDVPEVPAARAAGRRASPDQVRAAIVDATVRIVGRGGVAAVTHRAVAAEAGVSLSSTTYHFASKGEIVDEALRELARREIRQATRAARALEALDAVDPPDLVEAALGFLSQQLDDEDARLAARAGYHLQLEAAHRPALRGINDEWTAAAEALAAQVLRRAGSPAPETDAKLLAAALDGLRREEIISPRPAVAERLRPVIARLLGALIVADRPSSG